MGSIKTNVVRPFQGHTTSKELVICTVSLFLHKYQMLLLRKNNGADLRLRLDGLTSMYIINLYIILITYPVLYVLSP